MQESEVPKQKQYRFVVVDTWWYWVSMKRYWLIYDCTGSVEGSSGWCLVVLINICYFKMKFVMCGISSHSSWWQQEFSGWHNPLDCYDKETFNISILCWTYHFYCRENLLTNEHLLFLLWLLIRVIFWQTDDIFHVACFQYWGRVDLSQKIVSKKLSLPLFPRYVAKIKKTNWPPV